MKKLFPFLGAIAAMLLASASMLFAGPRHDTNMGSAPLMPKTDAQAQKDLEDFRHSWLLGDLGISFDFVHRPRRGEETRYTGLGWTSTNSSGPVTRFELVKVPVNKTDKPEVWEWLLQNGPMAQVWVLAPGATAAQEVPAAKWRAPLLPGMIYTPFDLMMPFLYWTDKYDGTDRILGRGVDVYTMNPPPAEKAAGIGAVKIFIDRELGALIRTQQFDAKGAVTLQFDLGHVAKIDDQWMFEDCQLLEKTTNDYDQFVVKSVALKLTLDPALFQPTNLSKPVPQQPGVVWHNM